MRSKGFSLLEVLVALMILALTYMALLRLHTSALHSFSFAKDIFNGVLRLELFLNGEIVEGVNSTSYTFKVKGYPITQKNYTTTCGKAKVFFRIYE